MNKRKAYTRKAKPVPVESSVSETQESVMEQEENEYEREEEGVGEEYLEMEREVKAETISKRAVLGGPLSRPGRLNYPQRAGYVRRVVNDDPQRDGPERIRRYLRAGWTIVKGDVFNVTHGQVGRDSKIGSPVVQSVGGGIKGVLMEIPEELYYEHQRFKEERYLKVEDSIRHKNVRAEDADEKTGVYGKVVIGR